MEQKFRETIHIWPGLGLQLSKFHQVSEVVVLGCQSPGKNLGKYSFRNVEGNGPISTDIGILQEYYCHTLVNCRYYL